LRKFDSKNFSFFKFCVIWSTSWSSSKNQDPSKIINPFLPIRSYCSLPSPFWHSLMMTENTDQKQPPRLHLYSQLLQLFVQDGTIHVGATHDGLETQHGIIITGTITGMSIDIILHGTIGTEVLETGEMIGLRDLMVSIQNCVPDFQLITFYFSSRTTNHKTSRLAYNPFRRKGWCPRLPICLWNRWRNLGWRKWNIRKHWT